MLNLSCLCQLLRLLPRWQWLLVITDRDVFVTSGSSQLVLRPKTTKEVSAVLKYCNSRRLAVVPQGGNTGLVAGSIPVFDEIVLSTQLMTDIISVDATSGINFCHRRLNAAGI